MPRQSDDDVSEFQSFINQVKIPVVENAKLALEAQRCVSVLY